MELQQIKQEFIRLYGGSEADLLVFSAPGRVNLIGEHVDYNGGPVFPAALTMKTTIVARPNGSGTIRLKATDLDGVVTADISRLGDYRDLAWGNYQLGVAYVMQQAGYTIHGCDLLYDDTIPHGGGLSSSAANEVATALLFHTLAKPGEAADMPALALLAQKAENTYCGVNCGIMDQFASAMGKKDHAVLLNCSTLEYQHVPLKLDGAKIVLANTNKKHSLASSKYNERRAECDEALSILQKFLNITCLADIAALDFERYKMEIASETVRRRAEHVVYECARVADAVRALNGGDVIEFGRLMNGSHDSLRDLYEVTGTELDTLVEEARGCKGTIGARMTGAGFGGCTVNIVKTEAVPAFMEQVGKAYFEKTGLQADFYVSEIGDGAKQE